MLTKPSNPSAALLCLAALACALGQRSARAQTPDARVRDEPAREGEQEPASEPAAQRPSGGAPPSDDAFRMGSPPALPEGMTEEQIWPAATAEGWRAPVLVRWQRSFDDALRVARAERRPLLVAVNMDGEIASEHFAGVRYREPATADLLSRYTCVIASVYRHTPRDYDERGRRVVCPRFGSVTCGEHIQAERELYETYFDGKRVSPRHIVLDLDAKETLDVYYSWDTETVFTTFVKGVEGWPEPIEPVEPTLADLVRSADVDDREALERAYVEGTREMRQRLLEALLEEPALDQVEVLRAGIFGFDLELAGLARRALALCETEGALDLLAEALQADLPPDERQLLLDAVARMSERSPRARTLGALHSGLSLGSRHIDAEALAREQYVASAARPVDVQARADAAQARPREPAAALDLAQALLARAHEARRAAEQQQAEPGAAERRYAELFFADARAAARDAERLGATGPRLDAVLAVAEAELGDLDSARTRAVAAIEGGLLRLGEDAAADAGAFDTTLDAASRTRLLTLFAHARQAAIRAAYKAGEAWPPEWLSDINAAYALLARDELVGAEALVDAYDFMRWIGAGERANAVLDQALERFPAAALLHDRLRGRLLWEGGPEWLEQSYAERLASAQLAGIATDGLAWYAGYASLVAAEHWRRRGELDLARAAYERAIAAYERNAELAPDGRDTCLHYAALGLAGNARIALERGELERATSELVRALVLHPDSAASQDGLGITPIMTARMLQARLAEVGDGAAGARVQAALDALDPRLLEPPPSERALGRRGGRQRAERPPQDGGR